MSAAGSEGDDLIRDGDSRSARCKSPTVDDEGRVRIWCEDIAAEREQRRGDGYWSGGDHWCIVSIVSAVSVVVDDTVCRASTSYLLLQAWVVDRLNNPRRNAPSLTIFALNLPGLNLHRWYGSR